MGKDKKKDKAKLPDYLELQRTFMTVGPEMNSHTNTMTSANAYSAMGVDNSWDFQEFSSNFKIQINHLDENSMEFDMIGIDPAIANALRRILIAEVPTVAIEHVFVVNNTSIIQDEVFAHRLGMVPIRVDPALFEHKSPEEAPSEKNTVVFKMDITCRRVGDRIENDKVLSKDLHWLPMGSEMPDETSCRFAAGQAHAFPEASTAPRPVHEDILLAKLRPGQTIQLEAHCAKGTGREHAKWSPVATAWYRMQPIVELTQEVKGDMADELIAQCPGLFVRDGSGRLQVTSARGNEQHLEKLRRLLEHEQYAAAVSYRKRKDHFIFTIETSGVLRPEDLFSQALSILEEKAVRMADKL